MATQFDLAGAMQLMLQIRESRSRKRQSDLNSQVLENQLAREKRLPSARVFASAGDFGPLEAVAPAEAIAIRNANQKRELAEAKEQREIAGFDQSTAKAGVDLRKNTAATIQEEFKTEGVRSSLFADLANSAAGGNTRALDRLVSIADAQGQELPSELTPETLTEYAKAHASFSTSLQDEGPTTKLRDFLLSQEGTPGYREYKDRPELQQGYQKFLAAGQKARGINLNLNREGNSDATKASRTKRQEALVGQRMMQLNLEDLQGLGDPRRFLGKINRAKIGALREAADLGDAAFGKAAGVFGMSMGDAELLVGDHRDFVEGNKEFFNAARKIITGAGASTKELEQLEKATLNPDLDRISYDRSIKRAVKITKRAIKLNQEILREGFDVGSRPSKADQKTNRAKMRELIAGGMSPQDAAKQVRGGR